MEPIHISACPKCKPKFWKETTKLAKGSYICLICKSRPKMVLEKVRSKT